MSFSQAYQTELRRLEPLFSEASAADKELHRAWDEGCAKLGCAEYKQSETYRRTLDYFHKSRSAIDEIVSTALVHAKLGDLTHLPTLFAYAAFPGRYSGSGYHRAAIWRLFKKLPLSDEQSRILRSIVVGQIASAGPEFVEMARTSRKLVSPDFHENIRTIGQQSQKDFVCKRINRLLSLLDSASND